MLEPRGNRRGFRSLDGGREAPTHSLRERIGGQRRDDERRAAEAAYDAMRSQQMRRAQNDLRERRSGVERRHRVIPVEIERRSGADRRAHTPA
jgi:hypothetical protein